MKIILKNMQSVGDIVAMAMAVKALHMQHPGKYQTDVRTPFPDLWKYNPYITPLPEETKQIDLHYPAIHKSNQTAVHFANGFVEDLARNLQINLEAPELANTLYLSGEERNSKPITDKPYWIIDAGHKLDYTAKQWGRWQEVVNIMSDTTFVQIGKREKNHFHPELKGDNVIDMVGKSNLRELILLIYHSFGVLTPISCPTWLSLATPTKTRRCRPCITIIGGREPVHYIQNPGQQVMHCNGMLDCCQPACWKSRIVALHDGDKKDKELCKYPRFINNTWVGKCMSMVSAEEVCNLMKKHLNNV